MKHYKKMISCVLLLFCILLNAENVVWATGGNPDINIGDYVIVGEYDETPIVWRCVLEDDNGKLLLSDRILCEEIFGFYTSNWREASIREWLGSTDAPGQRILEGEYQGYYKYQDGKCGFLYDTNFTASQRALMKSVTQWTMCPTEVSENGITDAYYKPQKNPAVDGGHYDLASKPATYYTIEDIPNIYYGAALQTTDRVFLPDEWQLYTMLGNLGTIAGSEETGSFFTRSTQSIHLIQVRYNGTMCYSDSTNGVRPAFYLDESAIADDWTGEGTLAAPYILNAPQQRSIGVSLNQSELNFDVDPIIQNDRVLVPFRAIFEALDMEVTWDGNTRTVIATSDDTIFTLQIDNPVMLVGETPITLDAAPTIVNSRTLVPLRAISEAVGATVSWDGDNRQVTIVTE